MDIITNNPIVQSIAANNPVSQVEEAEFTDNLLKFGTLISILKNRRISHTGILIEILENEELMECFKLITGIDDDIILFYNYISRYPVVCKSKIIKTRLSKHANRRRKELL